MWHGADRRMCAPPLFLRARQPTPREPQRAAVGGCQPYRSESQRALSVSLGLSQRCGLSSPGGASIMPERTRAAGVSASRCAGVSAGRQQLGSQQASADLRDTSTQERSAVACSTAAGGRAASCARRQRVGSEGRCAWRVAVRGRAHSQSIAEQGDSHRSGEGGSMGMLQKRSMSGARVGEGSASESPATRKETSGARWLTPGDIRRAVARCPTKRRSREREGSRSIRWEHLLKCSKAHATAKSEKKFPQVDSLSKTIYRCRNRIAALILPLAESAPRLPLTCVWIVRLQLLQLSTTNNGGSTVR